MTGGLAPAGIGGKHILFAFDQRGRVVAGRFEAVAVRDRVGGAGLHTIAAEDAAVVIDVVDLGVALAAGDPRGGGILGRFDIDTVGRARGGAQEARHALLHPVDVALQHMDAAEALFELGRRVGIIVGDRGPHHFLEGDAHTLGDCCRRTQDVFE